MVYVFKKVADYGVSHPVVARLSIQSRDIIQFLHTSNAKKEELSELYSIRVQPRVLNCTEVASAISKEIEEVKERVNAIGLRSQSHNRVIDIPQIMNLRERAEAYLYEAKSTLRDLSDLFSVLFAKKFGHARYNVIHEWATKEFGATSLLASFLLNEIEWISYIANLRNSVEHPENSQRGPLRIANFELAPADATGSFVLREPMWYFKGMNSAAIRIDMESIAYNLLTFSEELLVVAHDQIHPNAIVRFVEIAESDRSRECPVRIRAVLNSANVKK